MNVLFFSPYSAWTRPWGTDLELMERHLSAGDDVTVIVCDRALESCDPNMCHQRALCWRCVARRDAGLSRLSRPVRTHRLGELFDEKDRHLVDRFPSAFSSHDELKKLTLEGFDIGVAALSSLISWRRDSGVDLQRHAIPLRRLLRAAGMTYFAMKRYLRAHNPDRVYLFNGRLCPVRSAVRACEALNVPFFACEVGRDMHHFAMYDNALPHDIGYRERQIRKVWEKSPHSIDERETMASSWYERRAGGFATNDRCYTKEQQPGRLPDDWDSARHTVVAFTSSEHEFASIGEEWYNPLFKDQVEALAYIVEQTRSQSNFHLYGRVHPNLKKVSDASTRAILGLTGPHVTMIPPDSPVSSYSLLRACSTVLTFGSTIGIEAAYWNKPSVLVGRSFYQNLGSTYNPETPEELIGFLTQTLKPRSRQGALQYAYYHSTLGEPFRYYRALSFDRGIFEGNRIRAQGLTQSLRINGMERVDFALKRAWQLWQSCVQ